MILCHCHRVTASDARAACSGPDDDWRTVVKATRAATDCGGCVRSLRKAVEEMRAAAPARTPSVASAG